jgi:hypothetical protein
VFGPMTGRELPRKADGSLQDGDVLELSPDDMPTRASAPQLSFGTGKGHELEVEGSDSKDYDPLYAQVDPHVGVPVLSKLGRAADTSEADVRGTLEYSPEYGMVERTSRSVDFTKATSRPIEAVRDPNGDVLILDPKDDLLRKEARAVDLMHQSGRDDSTSEERDARDYDGADALDTLQVHLPAVRLDGNARVEPKKSDGVDVMYDPEDAITRPSAPAAVFGPMTGRELPRKADGSLQDGDVLELSPDDMPTRASAPHISFGNAKAHAVGPDALESGTFDYDPDVTVVRPTSRSADLVGASLSVNRNQMIPIMSQTFV